MDPTRDYIQSAGEVNDREGVIVPTEHHANASAEDIKKDHNILHTVAITEADEDGRAPTEEEKATLRHVSAPIPWYVGLTLGEFSIADRVRRSSYVVCVVELAERASYYGVSGVFTNFIQRSVRLPGQVSNFLTCSLGLFPWEVTAQAHRPLAHRPRRARWDSGCRPRQRS